MEIAHKLSRLRRLSQSMNADVSAIDRVLPNLRDLLLACGVAYKLVGGIAVVHHGYVRMTEDVDVLVDATGLERLAAEADRFGFDRESRTRLRHRETHVRVDLLPGGEPMPRPGDPPYPLPQALPASPSDEGVIALSGLIELKLSAHRHQDRADIVELLKPLDDAHYVTLESEVNPSLRPTLASLRRDALEELRFQT